MTKEQIAALERWIEAIIDNRDRASRIEDTMYLIRMRKELEQAFGLTNEQ